MLSEKQFRERARAELRQIGAQLKSIVGDRAIYRSFEQELVKRSPQLQSRNAFVDMVRGCYAEGMAARVLRLLESPEGEPSLPRLLAQLADYPELLNDRISQHEFADDRGALERAAAQLTTLPSSRAAHHERTVPALASTYRALDSAIDLLVSAVKTYYWIVADGCLDFNVDESEQAMITFDSAWAVPALA